MFCPDQDSSPMLLGREKFEFTVSKYNDISDNNVAKLRVPLSWFK